MFLYVTSKQSGVCIEYSRCLVEYLLEYEKSIETRGTLHKDLTRKSPYNILTLDVKLVGKTYSRPLIS
jgi:hypothetical protein